MALDTARAKDGMTELDTGTMPSSSEEVGSSSVCAQVPTCTCAHCVGSLPEPLYGWIPSRRPRLDYYDLFWVFLVNAMLGLCIETAFIGVVEHRFLITYGLVWGPFSPIYGFGALLFTAVLWRFWDRKPIVIFLVSFMAGVAFEFVVSLFMQYVFGVICWDYTGMPGNLGGRTNLFVGIGWGLLGVAWVNILFPLLSRFIDLMPMSLNKALSIVLTIFLVLDIFMTGLAFNRQAQRVENIPSTTPLEHMCDALFPQEWMAQRFPNQIVEGRDWNVRVPSNAGR